MPKLIVIAGATASGKSARAIEIASRQPSIIINADAMQLYRNAPILTAQPSEAERAAVPHHLYGILEVDDVCNMARWSEMVVPLVHEAWQCGQMPIVVGGTGLYLHGLLHGVAAIPEIDPAIRAQVRALPCEALYHALCSEDSEMAARLKPQDTQRLARALEVIRCTGKSLAWWHSHPSTLPLPQAEPEIIVCDVPRAELYARINQRYVMMVEQGGLEEARMLLSQGHDTGLPLMRAVGMRQLFPYLHGECTLEEVIIAGQAATRHYAKRQLTWIRHHL
jgi:tRNA dimethylallyltransferase